jgi:hypothetical protein
VPSSRTWAPAAEANRVVSAGARELDTLLEELADAVGEAHVLRTHDELLPYAVSLDPAGDVFPAAGGAACRRGR